MRGGGIIHLVRTFLWVLLLCGAIRVGVMGLVKPWDPTSHTILIGDGDPRTYHGLALNLMTGEGYKKQSPKFDPNERSLRWAYPDEPEALWPPGYPAFLALIYKLFGINLTAVIIAQILLAVAGCGFIMLATTQLWGPRAGVIAGVLYSLEPLSVQLSNTIWSEALYLPLIAGVVFLIVAFLTAPDARKQYVYLALLGAMLGAAAWVRVTAFPLMIALTGGVLLGQWYWQRDWRRACLGALTLTLTFGAVVAPWYWRNYQLFGVWAFSTSSAYNLLAGIGHRGDQDALFRRAYEAAERAGETPEQLNPFQRARYWRQVALEEWRKAPVDNLFLYIRRLGVVMVSSGASGWEELFRLPARKIDAVRQSWMEVVREFLNRFRSPVGLVVLFTTVYMAIFYGLSFRAVWRLRKEPDTKRKFYTGLAAGLAAVSILTLVNNTHPRGRLVALTLLMPVVAAQLISIALSSEEF